MPITNGKVSTEEEVLNALKEIRPFGQRAVLVITSQPYFPELERRIGRVIVLDAFEGYLLYAAQSNWMALEDFRNAKRSQQDVQGIKGLGLDQKTKTDLRPKFQKAARHRIQEGQKEANQTKVTQGLRTLRQLTRFVYC